MVIILRLRNKIILYAFILLCFMILSYSIYNIVKWKLDSNNTNKQIEKVQETVKVEEVIDTENTEIIEPEEEIPKSNPYWDYIKMNMIDINFNELKLTLRNLAISFTLLSFGFLSPFSYLVIVLLLHSPVNPKCSKILSCDKFLSSLTKANLDP